MDYKELLKKYIRYVYEMEGTMFLYNEPLLKLHFNATEQEVLEHLEKELWREAKQINATEKL